MELEITSSNGSGADKISEDQNCQQNTVAVGAVLERTRMALAMAILRQTPEHLTAKQYTQQLQLQAQAGLLEDLKRSRHQIAFLKRRLVEQDVNEPEVNISEKPEINILEELEIDISEEPEVTSTTLLDACLTLTSCSSFGGGDKHWDPARLQALHSVLEAVSVSERTSAAAASASSLAAATLLRLDRGRAGSWTSPCWSREVRDAVRCRFLLLLEGLLAESDCRLAKENGADLFRRLLHGPRLRLCLLEALLELIRRVAQRLSTSDAGSLPASVTDDAGLLFVLLERAMRLDGSVTGSATLPPPLLSQWRQLKELCSQRPLADRFPLFVYRLWQIRGAPT